MTRGYDVTRRREQANENRVRIVVEAHTRFLADGYAGTTIPAVAAAAGVSVQTVYKAFGTKAGLFKAVYDVAIVGDHEPVPVAQRPEVHGIQAEADPRVKLRMYTQVFVSGATGALPLLLIARDAAATDPAAAGIWAQAMDERLIGMGHFAEHLGAGGHLSVSAETAKDILWAYTSPEVWALLVVARGWPLDRFRTWLAEALIAALLRPS